MRDLFPKRTGFVFIYFSFSLMNSQKHTVDDSSSTRLTPEAIDYLWDLYEEYPYLPVQAFLELNPQPIHVWHFLQDFDIPGAPSKYFEAPDAGPVPVSLEPIGISALDSLLSDIAKRIARISELTFPAYDIKQRNIAALQSMHGALLAEFKAEAQDVQTHDDGLELLSAFEVPSDRGMIPSVVTHLRDLVLSLRSRN